MKKQLLIFLVALLLAFPLAAGAEESDVLQGVLEYKAAQSGAESVPDWLAQGLPAQMGTGGEWYALALSQLGGAELTACRSGLEAYLSANTVRSAATRQKLALTQLALGDEAPSAAAVLADSIGQQGVMSWIWGLHLLNNGCESPACAQEEVIRTLLSLRKEDGGWAVTGAFSDADATAMALQALAPHREEPAVAAAVDSALSLLMHMQTERGGFASYGRENAESAAQVVIALCALGIDPAADVRFIRADASVLDALLSYRLPDGSFSHELGGPSSEHATSQAFLALASLQRFREGKGSLYLLDGGSASGKAMASLDYKTVALLVIAGAAAVVCILLLVLGKRHPKNLLAVLMLAAAAAAFVLLTDFSSADDYYDIQVVRKEEAVGQVTLTIRCDTVAGKAAHIPADGLILPETSLPIAQGDTVYTLLTDAARACGFHMEASGSGGMMYIQGIGNIYEFDFGELSGWVFYVNGKEASVGCGQVVLRPGDRVEWRYSLALGNDLK